MADWYADIDLLLSSPLTDEALDQLIDAVQPLHGTLAVPQGDEDRRLSLSVSIAADGHAAVLQALEDALPTLLELVPGAVVTSLRVLDTHTRERENAAPAIPPLVSATEVGEIAGVSRARANVLVKSAGFPPQAVVTKSGPLWIKDSVQAWANNRDSRPGRRPIKEGSQSE